MTTNDDKGFLQDENHSGNRRDGRKRERITVKKEAAPYRSSTSFEEKRFAPKPEWERRPAGDRNDSYGDRRPPRPYSQQQGGDENRGYNNSDRGDYNRPRETGGYSGGQSRSYGNSRPNNFNRPTRPNSDERGGYSNTERSFGNTAGSDGGFRGRSEGFNRGGSEGNRGSSEGYKGRSEGFNRGNSDGGFRGRSEGFNRGGSEGGYKGRSEGFNRGGSEGGFRGRSEGFNRGGAEGGFRGRSEGFNRGGSEGGYKGRSEGFNRGGQQGGSGYGRPFQKSNSQYQNNRGFVRRPVEYKDTNIDPNAPIRLNKYMSNAGICSRREADEFIKAGVVSVNGEIVMELGHKVMRSDKILFHDQLVKLEKKVYVLLNKPKDCVTTLDDPEARMTVMDLVKNACNERIYPVGRLDRNTTGILLLTNDGDMASKLAHPKYDKKKIYHVWLDKDIPVEDLEKIAEGVELADGLVHADAISYATDTDKNQVGIEIHSGKNRVVRRIFDAMGYKVIKLDRVLFAGLTKKNLRRGQWRYLSEEEVNMLRMGAYE